MKPSKLLPYLFLLTSCSQREYSELDLIPKKFNELPGWEESNQGHTLPALHHSCKGLIKESPSSPMAPTPKDSSVITVGHWEPFCRAVETLSSESPQFNDHQKVRDLIEGYLTPYQISMGEKKKGTFTGYYVPILRGSLRKHGPYKTPLYRLPPKAGWRKLPRSRIVAGALKNKGLELVWVDDPIEAFFVQIQGSGKVQLKEGGTLNLSYAGQNGHPYFPIEKTLIDKGYLSSDDVTMHSIKRWLRAHPSQAENIMSTNPSYVYFKIRTEDTILGAQGVPLVPKASMAVDRNYISLGTPLWLKADHPEPNSPPLQQLLVAQDVGGAIKGAIRGNYFWGIGEEAAKFAGRMNSSGSLYVLLPKY